MVEYVTWYDLFEYLLAGSSFLFIIPSSQTTIVVICKPRYRNKNVTLWTFCYASYMPSL